MKCKYCGANIRVNTIPSKVKCPVCMRINEFLGEPDTVEEDIVEIDIDIDLEFELDSEE